MKTLPHSVRVRLMVNPKKFSWNEIIFFCKAYRVRSTRCLDQNQKTLLSFPEYFRHFFILIFKVSTEDLEEQMVGFEDYVQSVDIVAFNKI